MFNPLKKLFTKQKPVSTPSPVQHAPTEQIPVGERRARPYPFRRRVIKHVLRKSPGASRTPTVYAFIDSQNLNIGVLNQGGKLDFGKFRQYLKLKHNVTKAFLFIGYVEENKVLYDYLKRSGYICVFKKIIEYKDKDITVKGNIDADLVLHAMIEYPRYDKAIIVSGDGDFYPLIEYLAKKNKLLKVITPNKRYSSLLLKFLPYIISMEV